MADQLEGVFRSRPSLEYAAGPHCNRLQAEVFRPRAGLKHQVGASLAQNHDLSFALVEDRGDWRQPTSRWPGDDPGGQVEPGSPQLQAELVPVGYQSARERHPPYFGREQTTSKSSELSQVRCPLTVPLSCRQRGTEHPASEAQDGCEP